jgi:hypothetical protein
MRIQRGRLPAPEFAGLQWLDGGERSVTDLRGRPWLAFFWDFTDVHSQRALAYVQVWHGRYGAKAMEILGIHSPSFAFGGDPRVVREAVDELGVPFPVAIDASFATWNAYANRFWPAAYLVDAEGFVADALFGEGPWPAFEVSIQALLRESQRGLVLPRGIEPFRPEDAAGAARRPISPTVCLGWRRGRIANPEGFRPGEEVLYGPGKPRRRDSAWMEGRFLNLEDGQEHVGTDEGRIVLPFDAKDAWLVAAPADRSRPGRVLVHQDGHPVGAWVAGDAVTFGAEGPEVLVDRPRAFQVVRNEVPGRHVLTLSTRSPGLRFHCVDFTWYT